VVGVASNGAIINVASTLATEGNRNPQNVAFANAAIARLFSALPRDFADLRFFKVSGAAPNISTSFTNGIPGNTDTTDASADGTEIELVYNPTRNWRILGNVARQQTVQSNSFPGTKKLLALMTPVYNSSVLDPNSGRLVPLRNYPINGYALGEGPGNVTSSSGQLLGDWLDANVFVPFATASATEGTTASEQRKWRANLVTNYTFGRDSIFGDRLLKGWSIGGAMRWQSKIGIGFPTTRNRDGSVAIDIAHPYFGPAETNFDGWIGYQRDLFNKRIGWKMQLNARNLIGSGSTIPMMVQPTGEVAIVRLPPERRWYLTNTFSF